MFRRRSSFALAVFAISSLGVAAPARAQVQSTVYRFESAAAAVGSPSLYVALDRAVAGDAAGKAVAFHAKIRFLSGGGGADGVFTADPSAADTLEALRGQQAPSISAFRKLDRPTINASGEVAWSARLYDGTEGVFRSGPAVIAITGDPAPLASGTVDRFDLPIISDDAQVIFHATVFGGPVVGPITVGAAVFRCSGGDGNCHSGTGTLQALVAEGDLVPDRPGYMICDLFRGVSASLYGVSFKAIVKLDCSNLSEAPLVGVFRLPFGGAITTLALQGEAAQPSPGVSGTVYDVFEDVPVLNNLGAVTFLASVAGLNHLNSIYVCDPGSCPAAPASIAVSNGDLDANNNVLSRLGAPHISDAGDVSLRADARGITRAPGAFVWRVSTDTVERIVAKGDPVPGEANTFFKRIDRPWMSPGGRIAFRANTKGSFARRGIFLFE